MTGLRRPGSALEAPPPRSSARSVRLAGVHDAAPVGRIQQRLVLLVPAHSEVRVVGRAEHGEDLAAARAGAASPFDLDPVARLRELGSRAMPTPSPRIVLSSAVCRGAHLQATLTGRRQRGIGERPQASRGVTDCGRAERSSPSGSRARPRSGRHLSGQLASCAREVPASTRPSAHTPRSRRRSAHNAAARSSRRCCSRRRRSPPQGVLDGLGTRAHAQLSLSLSRAPLDPRPAWVSRRATDGLV